MIEQLLLANESNLRVLVFLSMLILIGLLEWLAPRREIALSRRLRWTNNLAIVALDTITVRIVFPLLAVGVAQLAHDNGWGVFNILELPAGLSIVISVILLDLAIYLQHLVFHAVPVLWRLHRMHHADTGFDLSTGLRFHPLEILLSMVIKLAVVVLFGVPAVAVMLFEIILSSTAIFNHGNVKLPLKWEAKIRWFLVTPDMHRIHHSVYPVEFNSNFGFSLSCWDRIFGTYTVAPKDGHQSMQIGLAEFRTRRDHWLDKMLLQPWDDGRSQVNDREVL